MRVVTWTIRLVLFVLLVALAAKNVEPVALRFFFGLSAQAPLVLWILGAFAVGALVGATALIGTLVRQRREISLLRRPAERSPPPAP